MSPSKTQISKWLLKFCDDPESVWSLPEGSLGQDGNKTDRELALQLKKYMDSFSIEVLGKNRTEQHCKYSIVFFFSLKHEGTIISLCDKVTLSSTVHLGSCFVFDFHHQLKPDYSLTDFYFFVVHFGKSM